MKTNINFTAKLPVVIRNTIVEPTLKSISVSTLVAHLSSATCARKGSFPNGISLSITETSNVGLNIKERVFRNII